MKTFNMHEYCCESEVSNRVNSKRNHSYEKAPESLTLAADNFWISFAI